MLISIINLVFNPFCLLLFFFYGLNKESTYFVLTDKTNVTRLKPLPYIIHTVIYVTIICSATYIWSLYSYEVIDIWEVFVPKNYRVSIPIWIIIAYTIYTCFKGMEGNVMGFIFFPLLVFSSLILIGINVKDLFYFNWKLSTDLPILKLFLWIRLIAHVFLPACVLLSINTDKNKDKREKDWLLTRLTISILQLILFSVHWLVIKLFGKSLTFSQFFGEEQTIL